MLENRFRDCCVCGSQNFYKKYEIDPYFIYICKKCKTGQSVRINNDVPPIYDQTYFDEINKYWDRRKEFYKIFEKLISNISIYKANGKLLDIGCGIGLLLDVARSKGYSVEGVEISEFAANFAKEKLGLEVKNCSLEEANYADNLFDIIVINHVMEHLENPKAVLEEINRILKPDGLLVIGVPNFGSYFSYIKRTKWYSLQPGSHIWHFNTQSMETFLINHNFKPLFFESENHKISGASFRNIFVRFLGWISIKAKNGEAILYICKKQI
jgi:2-polyprenyl-3-methyl-5-hydroxy-6-metoxy-1,4-benzoquinol methylase